MFKLAKQGSQMHFINAVFIEMRWRGNPHPLKLEKSPPHKIQKLSRPQS